MATVESILKAEHRDMSADEYHAHPAIGASMLETFRSSRREFHGRYIARTITPQRATAYMELGTLIHLLLLEPEKFTETVVTLPVVSETGEEWNWRKPSHREERDAILAGYATDGKQCIEETLMEQVQGVVRSIRNNWHARRLVDANGFAEYSIFWTDPFTELELKCRVDWFAAIPLDIKTTADPSPAVFARTATTLGYFRKAAHYAHGIAAFTGEAIPMVHLVAGTEPPYQIAVYDLDDLDNDGRSLGRRQWRETLTALKRCLDGNDWREPWEKQITNLRPPGWAFTEDSYLIGD